MAAEIEKVLASFHKAYSAFFEGEPGSPKRIADELRTWKLWEQTNREFAKDRRKVFHDKVSAAILNDDSKFFRKLADAIDEPSDRLRPIRFVFFAFEYLFGEPRKYGKLPTKGEVKKAAIKDWAYARCLVSGKVVKGLDEASKTETYKRVMKEIEALPEQKWSRLFKRAGLEDLPEDRPGPLKGFVV
jgi:hypothetical protein